MTYPLLEVRNLNVVFSSPRGNIRAVRGVSFELTQGRSLALVGESGSGKTTLALSLVGLLDGSRHSASGEILHRGVDITRLTESAWRTLRGAKIGMLFQDARGALNPVMTVEAHLVEAIRAHQKVSRRRAGALALRWLGETGFPDPPDYMRRFPSELSTGLCQRVCLALGICNGPELLIADEPASALDPTLQAQIVSLLLRLKRDHDLTLLLISHDLQLVAGLAERVAVMYHGRIVERGDTAEILSAAAHPYTRALLACRPDMRTRHEERRLPAIPGIPPPAEADVQGCPFEPRCSHAEGQCREAPPPEATLSSSHSAECWKPLEGPP